MTSIAAASVGNAFMETGFDAALRPPPIVMGSGLVGFAAGAEDPIRKGGEAQDHSDHCVSRRNAHSAASR
ncbi:hypothetical protein IP83_03740 [Novosphingobium sp. AAP93]|nr:hypothetical protein IP83_03740 [Novosphingobium sp. AAP93]